MYSYICVCDVRTRWGHQGTWLRSQPDTRCPVLYKSYCCC